MPPPLAVEHLADHAERLLPGGVDEPAGVDDDQVGLLGVGDEHVAVLRQQAEHPLGVDQVLRAAEAHEGERSFHRQIIIHNGYLWLKFVPTFRRAIDSRLFIRCELDGRPAILRDRRPELSSGKWTRPASETRSPLLENVQGVAEGRGYDQVTFSDLDRLWVTNLSITRPLAMGMQSGRDGSALTFLRTAEGVLMSMAPKNGISMAYGLADATSRPPRVAFTTAGTLCVVGNRLYYNLSLPVRSSVGRRPSIRALRCRHP